MLNPKLSPDQISRLEDLADQRYETRTITALDIAAIQNVLLEREALRSALIAVGRTLGCYLSGTVSTGFLLGIPKEAKLVLERGSRERAETYTEAFDMGRNLGLSEAAQHLEEVSRLAFSVIETDCSVEAHLFKLRAEEVRAMMKVTP